MAHRLIGLGTALVAILSTGCPIASRFVTPPSAGAGPSPVGLVAEGSAFDRPGSREALARAIERRTHRPVILIGEPSPAAQETRKRVLAGLARKGARIGKPGWQEPRCDGDRVLASVEANVAGIYRVTLDRTEHSRTASEVDLSSVSTGRRAFIRFLVATHGSGPAVVRDEVLFGTLTATPFVSQGGVKTVRIGRTAGHVEPAMLPSRLDAGAVVAEATDELALPREPDWDGFTARLLASGCPVLAAIASEMRPVSTAQQRRIRTAALAAVSPLDPRQPRPTAAEPPPTSESDANASSGSEFESYSCRDLCGLHMIEVCNHNRVLWEYYGVRWEATPCGTKRAEPFLNECYREQRLNGTYYTSCVRPCEDMQEDRDRLTKMLQSAGCLQPRS